MGKVFKEICISFYGKRSRLGKWHLWIPEDRRGQIQKFIRKKFLISKNIKETQRNYNLMRKKCVKL